MPTLADMLKNPNAYRGACGDLCAGALRLSPQELADLTLQFTCAPFCGAITTAERRASS